MRRIVKAAALLIAAIWFGVLFCVGFIFAPYLFILAARQSPAVPNTGVAADLIGPLLYSSDIISLVVGVALVAAFVYLRRQNEVPLGSRLYLPEIAVGLAAVCAAANYFWFAPRLTGLRDKLAEQYGAFHQADRTDPLFLQFDKLHHASTTPFMVGLAAALICLICMTEFRSQPPRPQLSNA